MGKNNRTRRIKKQRLKKLRKEKGRKKQISKESGSIGPVLQMMDHPFSNLDDDGRKRLIQEISENSEKAYQEVLTKIRKILIEYDPALLLSILASYGLTAPVGADGITKKDSEFTIYQAHIEICQALALQFKNEDLQKKPFGPDVVQELWDALVELTQSQNYRNINDLNEEHSDDEKSVILLQQWMRGNTQMVRNWGYFSQVKSIATEIYQCFDNILKTRRGFSVTDVIDLFQFLIDEVERKNTERFEKLSLLYKIKNKNELVYKYYELINLSKTDADEFISKIKIDSISRKSLFSMLMSHYDLRLSDIYTFTTKYVLEKTSFDEPVVKKMLDEFSYAWGKLVSFETEHIYLSNPIWQHPIINLDNDRYFCVLPQTFFSFIIPSLDNLIGSIDNKNLEERRAEYLEEKIEEIIKKRFPESNIVSNVKWKVDGDEFETDLITFIDSHVLIVEAKSGKITEPALRGAPERLKKHIKDIIVAPNIQSRRLQNRLEELINNTEIEDEIRGKLPVNLNDINKIIRISVTLEDFGSIQANVVRLKETGWLPDGYETCPTMNLADFETLFDLLEHPVQIIHYLERRAELENEVQYLGDELDLMGLYITTLFNVGDIDQKTEFIISEMSAPIDAYYNSKDAGIDIPKPKPMIHPLFENIFNQLEQRSTHRWTEIGVILNRFSPDDQNRLAKLLLKLEKNVRKNWRIEGHKNIAVFKPPQSSKYALCYVMYLDENSNRRKEFINAAAEMGLNQKHVEYCLVIAKNIDKHDLAYHTIGLFQKPGN